MRTLPALGDGAAGPPSSLIESARKSAYALARRYRYGRGCYDVDDLIQDGCVAQLQGRQAWYGCCDGLREWLGRRRTWTLVDLDEALDCSYVSDPMRRLIVEQEAARVMARMDRWPAKRRCAWLLRYYDDKSEAEIGAILGVTVGRVSQWLHEVNHGKNS